MSLADIIARKKAEAAGLKTLVTDNSQATDVEAKASVPAPITEVKTLPPLQKQEEAPVQVEKPLTFAEKMALKKAATIGSSTTGSAAEKPEAPNVEAPSVLSQTKPEGAVQSSGTVAPPTAASAIIPAKEDTGIEADEPPSEELAQAYADISHKIEILEALEDTDLESAMKDLKKALMANPNAVSLMHDTDYGKMVIALRRITKEAQIEAIKEKKPGAKKAQRNLILTAEEVEAVFNEL